MVEVPFDLHDHRLGRGQLSGQNVVVTPPKDFEEVMRLVLTGSYNSPNYAKYSFGDDGNVKKEEEWSLCLWDDAKAVCVK